MIIRSRPTSPSGKVCVFKMRWPLQNCEVLIKVLCWTNIVKPKLCLIETTDNPCSGLVLRDFRVGRSQSRFYELGRRAWPHEWRYDEPYCSVFLFQSQHDTMQWINSYDPLAPCSLRRPYFQMLAKRTPQKTYSQQSHRLSVSPIEDVSITTHKSHSKLRIIPTLSSVKICVLKQLSRWQYAVNRRLYLCFEKQS